MRSLRFRAGLLMLMYFACLMETEAGKPYNERLKKTEKFWNNLKPAYTKLQYAGGIGLISAGLGWNYGSSAQWETDAMMGFIPAYSNQDAKMTLTLKQHFLPWNNRRLHQNFTFDPLSCGLAVNSAFGNEFWVREPDKYPSSYYSFSTKLRFWFHLGQRITYHIPVDQRFQAKSITVFYEISSCDLFIVSAVGNSYLKPTDYLRLAFGVKFQIF